MPLVGVADGEGEAEDPVAGVIELEPRAGEGVVVWIAVVGVEVALGGGGVDVVGDPQAPASSATAMTPIAQLRVAWLIR